MAFEITSPTCASRPSCLWPDLLDEIFDLVLLQLTSNDVRSLRHVCRSWRSKSTRLLRELTPRHNKLRSIVRRFEGLEALHLQVEPDSIPSESQISRLQLLTSLRQLSLTNLLEQPQQPLPLGLFHLTHLTRLTLESCRIAEVQQLGAMTGLRCLSLRHCAMDLDQPPLMHLIAPLPLLNSLAIEPPPSYIVAPSARGLEGISSMASLTSLRLPSSPAISLASCRELAQLSHLRLLDLSHSNCARAPEALTDLHLSCLLPGLPFLQVLSLSGQDELTDDSICLIATSVPQLASLDLRSTDAAVGFTDAGICQLSRLSGLSSLRLSICQVGTAGCRALKKLPSLARLELSNCAEVNTSALCALGPITSLRSLCLHGCIAANDVGFAAIARLLTGLTHLDISACWQHLTPHGISSLYHLHNLQDLNLASCSRANDAGLVFLLPHLPGLTSLNLRNCEALKDESMAAVAASLTRLVTLDIRHCPGITPKCLASFASLPRLRTFEFAGSGLECHAFHLASQQTWRHLTPSPQRTRPWWMSHPPVHQPLPTQPSADEMDDLISEMPGPALGLVGAGSSQVLQHNPSAAHSLQHGMRGVGPPGSQMEPQGSAMSGKPNIGQLSSYNQAPHGDDTMDSDAESYSSSRSSMSLESLASILPD
ncbi:hypothetical protein WJX74_000021 [Apatococcus lobatus]|uniref:F-box/LRR-repeat protein 15-like leucin rich repeat domain-containing protein n=1 Tax=Apatococcus lobatus TaxID=904363 RepID=A0AAW1QYK3_9CHLO